MKSTIALFALLAAASFAASQDAKERIAPNGVRYKESTPLQVRWRGPAAHALQSGLAKPMGLAAADFNGDKVRDLAAIWEYSGQSILAIFTGLAGNVKDRSPFQPDAITIQLPEPATRIFAADFNGDGFADLVTAAEGSRNLFYFESRGDGTFADARRIELDGALTAIVMGDINRPDGLMDLAVATATRKLHLFTHPHGAMMVKAPESHDLPLERADSLRIAATTADGLFDVIATHGNQHALLRKGEKAKRLADAELTPLPDESMIVPMQFAGVPGATYVGFTGGVTPSVLAAVGGLVYVVNDSRNDSDPNFPYGVDDGICNSTPVNQQGVPTGGCTYRAAIENLNYHNVPGTIQFAVSKVTLVGGADILSVPAVVDGTTAPAGFVTITCTGSGGPTIFDPVGVHLAPDIGGTIAESPSTRRLVKGMHVTGCNTGIRVSSQVTSVTNPTIIQNVIQGTGTGWGIIVTADGAIVGNANPALSNTISNVGLAITSTPGSYPVLATSGAKIVGNKITNVQGGIIAYNTLNFQIGGINAGEGNSIDVHTPVTSLFDIGGGNFLPAGVGVVVLTAGGLVQGNYIGNDGTQSFGGIGLGMYIAAANTTVGGTVPAARNYVAGMSATHNISGFPLSGGIDFNGTGNIVQGNYVGVNAAGTAKIATDGDGVIQENGSNNQVLDNVIGGMSGNGVYLRGGSQGVLVQGNRIGVNKTGSAAIANGGAGIDLYLGGGNGNALIGGEAAGQGNVISGNAIAGIATSLTYTDVKGNTIGLDATASYAIPNNRGIDSGGGLSTVGGTTPAAANIISGNTLDGVYLNDCCSGLTLTGNYIGTNKTFATNLGNGGNGVSNICCSNVITNNFIHYNGGDGVLNGGGTARNSIFGNQGVGIDLQGNGVQLITLQSASSTNGTTVISGQMPPGYFGSSNITAELYASPSCSASGFGQGKTYLGRIAPPTQNFSFSSPVQLPAGQVATAVLSIASSTGYNSNQFSACIPIATCAPDVSSQLSISRGGFRLDRTTGRFVQAILIANNGAPLSQPLALTFDSLPVGTTMFNPAGTTGCSLPASPFVTLPALASGASTTINVEFVNPSHGAITYNNRVLSGANR